MKKTAVIITAILVIGGLLAYALHLRIDGLLLAGGVAVIAGLAGYVAPHKKPPTNS